VTRNTKKYKHSDRHGIITKTVKTRKPTQKNKKKKKDKSEETLIAREKKPRKGMRKKHEQINKK